MRIYVYGLVESQDDGMLDYMVKNVYNEKKTTY